MNLKKIILLSLFSFGSLIQAQSISYTLKIEEPKHHIAKIQMDIPVLDQDSIELALPAWAPGRYVIYNFSKNIFDLRAKNVSGEQLKLSLLDKQSCKIMCQGSKTVRVTYKVFANTLDGSFSKIDSSGASINGPGIFLYRRDAKQLPTQLKIIAPADWQIITPLKKTAEVYEAKSYDQLIDSPIEMGHLKVYSFQHLGKLHQLVFHQTIKPVLISQFIIDLKKVIGQQANVFDGILPYQRYVFFFHLKPDLEHTDGMEHHNSCRVLLHMSPNTIKPDANSDPDYDNLIWLSAHEYFHLWNVKRIRPAGLGPFDYTEEVYTKSLWLVEGLTSYYAYLSLIRSGIYSEEKFLSEISGRIKRYENDPGRTQRTLEEVSLLTWLFKGNVPEYEQTNINETTYSYYYKGLIVGLLLDLKIRAETQNTKSLDDVLRVMFQRFYPGKQKSYYLPGLGYTEQQFEELAEKISGIDLHNFFATSLRSTRELDYSLLNSAGLVLDRQVENQFILKRIDKLSRTQYSILRDWLF